MRRLGRRNARQSSGLSASARLDNTIHALTPYSWARADSYTIDGVSGKTASFPDIVRPGTGIRAITAAHAYTQATSANQVAVPATRSTLRDRLTGNFSAGQFYVSNSLASSWIKSSNGTGFTAFCVLDRKTVTGVQYLYSTYNAAANGAAVYTVGATLSIAVYNAAVLTINASAASEATGATFISSVLDAALTPDATVRRKTTSVATANASGGYAAGDPSSTMTIGAIGGGANGWLDAYAAEWLFFDRAVTSDELTIVHSYIATRYGVT